MKRVAPQKPSNEELKQDQDDNPELYSKNDKSKRSNSREKDSLSPKEMQKNHENVEQNGEQA